MTVLFNSSRPLGRCENLTAIWDAYDGPKMFVQGGFGDMSWFDGDVVVTDEFVSAKRHGQTVVMVEHAISGVKRWGNDQPHGVYTPEACSLLDWYVTSSEGTRGFAASAAGIPLERCLPFGLPRTDAYVEKRKGDGNTFMARYGHAYLYVPTFRAPWEPPAPEIDWQAVDDELRDDEVIVVKRHMLTSDPIASGNFAHIVEVGSSEPSTPYLIDCDVVITDYSSIFIDGYLLGKPSALMRRDAPAYLAARGMYLDYPGGYGSVTCSGNAASIVMAARLAESRGIGARERSCMDVTAGACDGRSTERVVEFVRSLE